MVSAAGVTGVNELEELGRRLKGADPTIKKELQRGIRDAGKPVVHDIKAGIGPSFPNKGGMNALASRATIGLRTRFSGRQAGIRLQASGRKGRSLTTATLKATDESGEWRRPIWPRGDRRSWRWTSQTYGPAKGWFTEPAEESAPHVKAKLAAAMERTADQLVRGL